MIRALISAVLLAASLVSCTSGNTSVQGGPVNTNVWVKDSQPLTSQVIQTLPGAQHCGDQNSVYLILGWPLGHSAATVLVARWYVQNPDAFLGPELMSKVATGIT